MSLDLTDDDGGARSQESLPPGHVDDPFEPRRFSGVVLTLVAVTCLVLGAVGGLLAAGAAGAPTTAAEGSVDAGFARDMQAHHAQAVDLAVLVRDRSADDEVRTVALDILLTQQNQIGRMAGWLRAWSLPAASQAEPMAWMTGGGADGAGHGGHGGHANHGTAGGYAAMPGWVAAEDLARLSEASGAEADRLFLELMIDHHRGGMQMAQYAAEHAQVAEVVAFAEGLVTAQERETVALEHMYEARR